MTDHCGTGGTARPIFARPILTGWKRPAIWLRSGQYVVIIRRIASPGDDGAALGQCTLHVKLVVVAVQIVDVRRDNLTLKILPRASSDAITSVDCRRAAHGLGAENTP